MRARTAVTASGLPLGELQSVRRKLHGVPKLGSNSSEDELSVRPVVPSRPIRPAARPPVHPSTRPSAIRLRLSVHLHCSVLRLRLRPSIRLRPSVRPSVRLYVRPPACPPTRLVLRSSLCSVLVMAAY